LKGRLAGAEGGSRVGVGGAACGDGGSDFLNGDLAFLDGKSAGGKGEAAFADDRPGMAGAGTVRNAPGWRFINNRKRF
jgi:hypothetical protein